MLFFLIVFFSCFLLFSIESHGEKFGKNEWTAAHRKENILSTYSIILNNK